MTYPNKCHTCGNTYSKPPSGFAIFCSSSFHCCRDCIWEQGQIIEMCEECAIETLKNRLEWELMKNDKEN